MWPEPTSTSSAVSATRSSLPPEILTQEYLGWGFPSARQLNRALVPSLTLRLLGWLLIIGPSAIDTVNTRRSEVKVFKALTHDFECAIELIQVEEVK